jgi:hypothetical protein
MRTVLTSVLTLLVLLSCGGSRDDAPRLNGTLLGSPGNDGRLLSTSLSAYTLKFSEPIESYQLQVTSAGSWPTLAFDFIHHADDFDLVLDVDRRLEPERTYELRGVVEHLASGRVPFEVTFTTHAAMEETP